jgi:sulfur-carrier protein adenylyltransferase/sulfurtransferase
MLDFNKFERQIILPNFGVSAQQKLHDAKVLIVGAGGLGCPVILYLSAAGIGNIGIAENDEVSINNLHRQILFNKSQIGELKTKALQQRLPDFKFNFHPAIDKINALEIINQYDIIVDTTDNFSTRYLINDACVLSNKVLVSASIHQFNGQLGVFNFPLHNNQRSGTYRCLFPEAPKQSLNCAEAGVLSTVAGVMGTLQAHETIKVITGIGNILYNKLLIWDGQTMQQNILQFEKDELAVAHLIKNGLLQSYDLIENCETENTNDISVKELKLKIQSNELFQLIDVREQYEHEEFNIGGDWMQMNDLIKQPQFMATDKPVILYCKVGERSKIAQQRLQDKFGFTNIYNLKGGIMAWKKD